MSSQSDLEAGMAEMDYSLVDNGVIEVPSSKPAAFAWIGEPAPDVEALEEEMEEHDFRVNVTRYETRDDGAFYCHFRVTTDHYKTVMVRTWTNRVRIYPREDLPDTYEFARIVHAVEDAFGAELEHHPIDDNDE